MELSENQGKTPTLPQAGPSVVVVGAGPAGLTAAYLLAKKGVAVHVLEADAKYVGGISRTVNYKGFQFDIGGHRFFSKSKEVEDFWTELLPDDLLQRPRSSRIFYRGKFFSYPLRAFEALFQLGIFESIRCVLSYMKARIFPVREVRSFEDWVCNQFGRRLFSIFFKTYTEKVWGMSCSEISADWAAQRIRGLSLASAIKNAIFPRRSKNSPTIKTLIDTFRYPRRGPGMLWEECARRTQALGGTLTLGSKMTALRFDETTQNWHVTYHSEEGLSKTILADHVISSAPLKELVEGLNNPVSPVSPETLQAAQALGYRDFLTVVLIYKGQDLFQDNWIYIHDPNVSVGRIQNFKSWSPEMVPGPQWGCYGLEYFCFEGDGIWNMSDEELIEMAKREMKQMGFDSLSEAVDGCVVRQPKAYPVYDDDYAIHVKTIRDELKRAHPTLHPVGRNGMHKYNNQDHAIMTAMLTVENILAGKELYDVWRVNEDAEYHEALTESGPESGASGLRDVPQKWKRKLKKAA